MLFYALTDSRLAGAELGEVVEFYATLDEAERARNVDCDKSLLLILHQFSSPPARARSIRVPG
jgi:hypothetical protein